MTDASPDALIVAALERLAAQRNLLVVLDFDGTIAPLVDDPAEAAPIPEAAAAIRALDALPFLRVALLSGRSLDSLIAVSDVAQSVLLVASHGIERLLDSNEPELSLHDDERAALTALAEILEPVAAAFDGVWLEHKPAGCALHSRLARAEDALAAEQLALDAAARPPFTVRRGKNVLEFSVRATHKGEAITDLRAETRADAVLFAGDDVTDEDAFAVLGGADVGIKIGAGETRAQFRLDSPLELANALHALAEIRAAQRL